MLSCSRPFCYMPIGHCRFYPMLFLISLATNSLANTEVHKLYPAPAISMNYKMVIEAGREFCYFQYVYPNSVFHVNFQVIRGGDGLAIFSVKDPRGNVVLPYEWNAQATYESAEATEGYYSVCVNNVYSTFAEKLVTIYMATYEARSWKIYSEEITEIGVDAENFVATLSKVDERIQYILHHLNEKRASEGRDHAALLNNNFEIPLWSFIQCLIISASGLFYVYFIRQLFQDTPTLRKFKIKL